MQFKTQYKHLSKTSDKVRYSDKPMPVGYVSVISTNYTLNGVEIFDGDFVSVLINSKNENEKAIKAIVQYDKKIAVWCLCVYEEIEELIPIHKILNQDSKIEVLGNFYNNKDTIKQLKINQNEVE